MSFGFGLVIQVCIGVCVLDGSASRFCGAPCVVRAKDDAAAAAAADAAKSEAGALARMPSRNVGVTLAVGARTADRIGDRRTADARRRRVAGGRRNPRRPMVTVRQFQWVRSAPPTSPAADSRPAPQAPAVRGPALGRCSGAGAGAAAGTSVFGIKAAIISGTRIGAAKIIDPRGPAEGLRDRLVGDEEQQQSRTGLKSHPKMLFKKSLRNWKALFKNCRAKSRIELRKSSKN